MTAAAGVAGLLVGFAAAWLVQGWRTDAEVNGLIAEHAQERSQLHADLAAAESAARTIEKERSDAQAEIQRLAARSRDVAAADRRRADAAGRGLLVAARAAASDAQAACGTGAAAGSPAAGAGFSLLPDVLGEVDAAAGELAAALDEARIAGDACERAYDSLIPISPPRGD